MIETKGVFISVKVVGASDETHLNAAQVIFFHDGGMSDGATTTAILLRDSRSLRVMGRPSDFLNKLTEAGYRSV